MNILLLTTLLAFIAFLAATGAGAFPWTLAAATCLLGLVAALSAIPRSPAQDENTPVLHPRIEHVMVAILVLLLLSLTPLPRFADVLTGPRRQQQNEVARDALQQLATIDPTIPAEARFSLTRNRAGTMRITLLIAAILGVHAITTRLAPSFRSSYLHLLVLFGAGLAIAGYCAQWIYPQGDTLWWVFPIPHGRPGPVTCFVNRNHYAGFLAMLAPVAAACLIDGIRKRCIVGSLIGLLGFTAITGGVVFSLSRGSWVAYLAGLCMLPVLFLSRRRFAVGTILIVAAVTLTFGISKIPHTLFQDRLQSMRAPATDPNLLERASAWKGALFTWRAYPLIGAGANAFRVTFPQHRHTSARAYRTHAENEYAQGLAESGLLGTVLFALLGLAVGCRIFRATQEEHTPLPLIAAGGALAVVAVHAAVDFAPHVPLYTLVFTSIVSAALPREDAGRSKAIRLLPALVLLLCAALLAPFSAAMRYRDDPRHIYKADHQELRRALLWSPVSWQAWHCLGDGLVRRPDAQSKRLGAHCLTVAGQYDPNNYVLWSAIGKLRLWMNDYDGARSAFARVKKLRAWVQVPLIPLQE